MGGIEAAWLAGKTIKTMGASITGVNRYMSLETPDGTDYQVPAGKKLKILRLKFNSTVANMNFYVGYGDTGVADGTSAPTNLVAIHNVASLISTTASTQYAMDVYYEIPAAKYPCLTTLTTSGVKSILVEGVEEV